ncbi:hypothetical protein SLS53_004456 [Cytospora paraplurivora]|uniref:Uncharacterized protein n=1 Tax=Cytospora paraplurivora TaxID=2898453 RepID=A0AAN9YFL5_9PEZI
MAPQTRSRASDGDARVSYHEPPPPPPPPATASASKPRVTKRSKVYRRSDPAPQQVHFSTRKKTIRTYGKGRRSLPPKTPDQSTLTQIGWIPSTYQDEEDEDDLGPITGLTTVDDDDDDWNIEDRRRGKKRRKTAGHIVPDSTASSSYHTQTLTQMPSFMSGQQPEEDDEFEGDLDFNTDVDPDPTETAPSDKIDEASPEKRGNEPTASARKGEIRPAIPLRSPIGSVVAQTPRKQIVGRAVIPSSQPSPFTPNLGIADRYWTNLDRTPLKDRSTNVDAPTPKATGMKRPRTLEVADSWSTVNGGVGSSPHNENNRVHRTPLKEIPIGELADVSVDLGESPGGIDVSAASQAVIENRIDTGMREEAVPRKSTRPSEEVILDSDDEFDFDFEDEDEDEDDNPGNEEAPGTPTPVQRASAPGADTTSHKVAGTPSPSATRSNPQSSSHPVTDRNPTPEPPAEKDEVETDTPSPSPQRRPSVSSAVGAERETPISSPQKTSPALPPLSRLGSHHRPHVATSPQTNSPAVPPVSQLGYRYKSQAFESQRVPFERILQLGPQTDRSDIILSVHPEHVEQIAEGVKTHEFRNYRIPQTVGRIWIYVTRPVCELVYMAPISAAKQPGEISPEDPGVGNKEFNAGAGTKFAYELKQVYELNNPVPLARMKENGWVEEAPAKYVYVPPAVLGELLGNLRCALFAEPGELQSSQPEMSVSQEVAMQIRSDVAHSTQMYPGGSSQRPGGDDEDGDESEEDAVPSSQAEDEQPNDNNTAARSTGAPVVDGGETTRAKPTLPQTRSQRIVHWTAEDSSPRLRMPSQPPSQQVRPSQATTASAPSSPSQQLPPPPPPGTPPSRWQAETARAQAAASIPLSPPTRRSAAARRRPQLVPSSSGGVSSSSMPPTFPEDLVIVGDSPVRQRPGGGGGLETQTSLLMGSSQGFALGEPDSLLDDSRVRQPPDVVWDSEGDMDE